MTIETKASLLLTQTTDHMSEQSTMESPVANDESLCHQNIAPLISVIMPSYNSERFIAQSIDSVLSQTYQNIELLITDDGSEDRTIQIVEQLALQDSRVSLVQFEKNQGAALARNASLSRAKGDYIAFLDSDDLWLNSKIEQQLHFMQSNYLDLSFTAYEITNQYGQQYSPAKIVDMRSQAVVGYYDMLKKMATMGCSTVMIRRGAFSEIVMPPIRTGQDYGLWLSLLKQDTKAHCLREILTRYRDVPGSISSNKWAKVKRQYSIYRDLEAINLPQVYYYLFHYAKNAVFRK